MAKKPRVVVLFGGKSGEHEVSLESARSTASALDSRCYDVIPIGITLEGYWLNADISLRVIDSDLVRLLADELGLEKKDRARVPSPDSPVFSADVIVPVLHGTFGEDGTVQGMLELAGVPYVGSGVLGSSLGLDKIATKAILETAGVPFVDYYATTRIALRNDPVAIVRDIEERFAYPVFVKPANMGSSVGVSKAHNHDELIQALELAARYDRRLLVERSVNAREIECSVLGNESPEVSVLGEVVPCNEFYDYAAKYLDGDSELIIPADLPEDLTAQIRDWAAQAFVAMDCAGLARVDFLVSRDDSSVYLNELNTMPGFTPISMYPKLWAASGLSYSALLDRLIALALERAEEKGRSETRYIYDH